MAVCFAGGACPRLTCTYIAQISEPYKQKKRVFYFFLQLTDLNGNFSLQAASKMRGSRFPTRFLPEPARHGQSMMPLLDRSRLSAPKGYGGVQDVFQLIPGQAQVTGQSCKSAHRLRVLP